MALMQDAILSNLLGGFPYKLRIFNNYYGDSEMQDILCLPRNIQPGSPPPTKTDAMEAISHEHRMPSKEMSQHSDSGVFSATANSTFPDADARSDSDARSDCSSPRSKFICPICDLHLNSHREFSLHIRSHNNTEEEEQDKSFTCKVCFKVLSSSSSLDRHVLVHSGERPFTCKYCGDTFTTNGNMHRHMRTHRSDSYESDGSSDSSKTEYNNNKIDSFESKKRKLEPISEGGKRFKESSDDEHEHEIEDKAYKCPVCERNDFSSYNSLEAHLQDNHPDYPAKCGQCGQLFKNNKLLNYHRITVHSDNAKKNYIMGFKELTYMDFSSEKFKHIARVECERNFHKTTGVPKFICPKCSRGFPCGNSLEIHYKECSVGLDLSMNSSSLDLSAKSSDLRRADFFARLDLQDKSPEVSPNKLQARLLERAIKTIDNSKDLADIQSIISMTTNGSLLQQLQAKTNELSSSAATVPSMLQDMQPNHKNEEEEAQDLFTAEFRKMKLRGEFPCRLCDAVFPNLRALKGHNRTHLNGNNNGTYRCNMCPHSSIDKAALIRHMRTHNGDRPYECSLCNYAFTTKANCERHLRNRHAKTTREEVKKSIIYHPSEDPTNDELNKLAAKDDSYKKSSSSNNSFIGDITPESVRTSTPEPVVIKSHEDNHNHPDFNTLLPLQLKAQQGGKFSPYAFTPNYSNTSTPQSKIQVKSLDLLKQPPKIQIPIQEERAPSVERQQHHQPHSPHPYDQPLDLVLDLSKKKVEESQKPAFIPEDLSKKFSAETPAVSSDILHQQLLKNQPKFDSSLYASQIAMMYRNTFPGLGIPNWPGFPINPLLFQTMSNPLMQAQDSQELKERLQRLQMCGGGIMMDNFTEQLKNFGAYKHGATTPDVLPKYPNANQDEIKPLTLNIDSSYHHVDKLQSPVSQKSESSNVIQSPNSVKMVIKNGVLMPKQKQRRYRTERPFSCEHCSARFTLRSNMERHIKQQHPQYWSQRQRSNVGTPGRKPASLHPPSGVNLNIPSYEVPKVDYEEKDQISDKLKYAILAQHLRQANPNNAEVIKREEDDDGALVIDEKEPKVEQENKNDEAVVKSRILEEKLMQLHAKQQKPTQAKSEESQDLVPVSRLIDNAANQQPFREYFQRSTDEHDAEGSEEDEEGLVASGSASEANSGTDENRSESEVNNSREPVKKKSAYSLAPNRVTCPFCSRKFPWSSSLRRHVLTHTGQKPYKCSHCPLLFTTKSNCDRHLLRKHGNAATTISNEQNNPNNPNYLMRNVPERPFKCSSCPSSTFSTYSNLKKHMSCKHSEQGDDGQIKGYETGSSEDEKMACNDVKIEWEHVKSSSQERGEQVPNSDLPFKCHLCDGSFGDRQDALDHIRDCHVSEYELLMSKNALDNSSSTQDEGAHHEEDDHEMRGKFPDYSNRKVICAFCMRRFWSAEDLRRHMRTHTGERPFSCDICRRRFTLKHSMLRHRKKHNIGVENADNANSDEDNVPSYESLRRPQIDEKPTIKQEKEEGSDGNEGGDLISNLLGIRDRSIIDQVLTSSADDAAKLLGVKGQ